MNRQNSYINDVLESISIIRERADGLSEIEFKENGPINESVIYRLAIIGEAINQLPKNIFEKYNEIDWKGIVAMRNILIHEYAEVDLNIVWDTIQNELALLEKVLRRIKQGQK